MHGRSIASLTITLLARRNASDMPSEMFRYQLTSVITHEGKLDNGHYWACVKSGHEWFHMDDEKGWSGSNSIDLRAHTSLIVSYTWSVSPIALSKVLVERAYMLFYVKTSIAFAT